MSEAELVNKAFRVILLAVEDVVGKHGTDAILRQAGLAQYINNLPPSNTEYGGHQVRYMSQVNHALFDVYGIRGAKAILRRAGKQRALNALEENATLAAATRLAMKFLPRRAKVKLGMDTVAREYSQQLNTQIKFFEEGAHFYWEDLRCGNCIDWQSNTPVCHTTVGFIGGMIAWALDDNNFAVEEVQCCAKGDAVCKYRITLQAE